MGRFSRFYGERLEDVLQGGTLRFLAWADRMMDVQRAEDLRLWRVAAAGQSGLSKEGWSEFRSYLTGEEASAEAEQAREKAKELQNALMNIWM